MANATDNWNKWRKYLQLFKYGKWLEDAQIYSKFVGEKYYMLGSKDHEVALVGIFDLWGKRDASCVYFRAKHRFYFKIWVNNKMTFFSKYFMDFSNMLGR